MFDSLDGHSHETRVRKKARGHVFLMFRHIMYGIVRRWVKRAGPRVRPSPACICSFCECVGLGRMSEGLDGKLSHEDQ